MAENISQRELLSESYLEIKKLRSQLVSKDNVQYEPIAIVGGSCRFPGGADSLEKFWKVLEEGKDSISTVPSSRWDVNKYYSGDREASGKMYTTKGGFIHDVNKFDPAFFSITPVEAENMDPQQRILLEVSWEALENSFITAGQLKGSQSGIFIGMGSDDYSTLQSVAYPDAINPYGVLGASRSIAVGRLAYWLDFHGPVMQVDTSCSSALMAVHLACRSLQAKECDIALAGGVNLILSPHSTISFCKLNALSPEGYCKTFDSSADGYARAEGCGIIVLKRLQDAINNEDNILAVIKGSAVNHDGFSNGMTAPNGKAQEAVIQKALNVAGVSANDIQYVEAHGTGTLLGDPIELHALSKVFDESRDEDSPLYVGSVKTNLGHLEAAAGISGLMKVIMSLKYKTIPPHLHFKVANPHFAWSKSKIKVPLALTKWPASAHPALAGVSSFGMSGTNVHFVVEQAPDKVERKVDVKRKGHELLCLSAISRRSLRELIKSYIHFIEINPHFSLAEISQTANLYRHHFDERISIVADTKQDLQQKLLVLLSEEQLSTQVRQKRSFAYLFLNDSIDPLQLKEVALSFPSFGDALAICDEALARHTGISISQITKHTPEYKDQMELFSFVFQYCLAALLKEGGVTPSIAVGRGNSACVAACIAGVIDLDDALRLLIKRIRFQKSEGTVHEQFMIGTGEDHLLQQIKFHEPQVKFFDFKDEKYAVSSIAYWNDFLTSPARYLEESVPSHLYDSYTFVSFSSQVHFHSDQPQADDTEEGVVPMGGEYRRQILELLSTVYRTGKSIDWRTIYRDRREDKIQLPTYPFERNEYPFQRKQLAKADPTSDVGLRRTDIASDGKIVFELIVSKIDDERISGPLIRAVEKEIHQLLVVDNYFLNQFDEHELGAVILQLCMEKGSNQFQMFIRNEPSLKPSWRPYGSGILLDSGGVNSAEICADESDSISDLLTQLTWVQQQIIPVNSFNLHELNDQMEQTLLNIEGRLSGCYKQGMLELEQVSIQYIIKSFHELGWSFMEEQSLLKENLVGRLKIIPRFERLANHFLHVLSTHGIICEQEDKWIICTAHSEVQRFNGQVSISAVCWEHAKVETTLLERCASKLTSIFRGLTEPLELLFEDNEITLSHLYMDSQLAKTMNPLIAESIQTLLQHKKSNEKIRILEVGAGTGGTTCSVLSVLAGRNVSYTFTDVSNLFLVQAKEKFAGYDFLDYKLLNIENEIVAQGFRPGDYDLIIGSNVVHATRQLSTTLKNIESLLAPNGTLMMWEVTHSHVWLSVVAGILDGWWRFLDHDIRPSYPLMSETNWCNILQKTGFCDTHCYSPFGNDKTNFFGQSLIVSKRGTGNAGQWTVITNAENVQPFVDIVEASGETCSVLCCSYLKTAHSIDLLDPPVSAQLIKQVVTSGKCKGVIYVVRSSVEINVDNEYEEILREEYLRFLNLINAFATIEVDELPALWLVTQGSQPVMEEIKIQNVFQSVFWGLSKTLVFEYPEFWRGIIDLSALPSKYEWRKLYAYLQNAGAKEPCLAIRGNDQYVQRLVPIPGCSRELQIEPNGTYLVVGGLTGLGLYFSKWLIRMGAKSIAIVSKNGICTQDRRYALNELIQTGAIITMFESDVTEPTKMAYVFAKIEQDLPPIKGIINSAAVLHDAALADLNWNSISSVIAPKVIGTINLHRLSQDLPLDFFVCFSSVASFLPTQGQGVYASANAFMDAFVNVRKGMGLKGLTINWGPFSSIGLGIQQKASVNNHWKSSGIQSHDPEEGISAFQTALRMEMNQVGVLSMNWATFAKNSQWKSQPLFDEFTKHFKSALPAKATLFELDILNDLSSENQLSMLYHYLIEKISTITGVAPAEILDDRYLSEIGFDSLMATDLRNKIKKELQIDFNAVNLLQEANVLQIAVELQKLIMGKTSSAKAENLTEFTHRRVNLKNPLEAQRMLADIDKLSAEQIDQLLNEIAEG